MRIYGAVTNIGNYAFNGCSNLTTVYVHATTPPTLGTYVFDSCPALTRIYVPSSKVSAYKAATNWSKYSSKIYGM
jgi:hypothetical protein